MNKPKPKAVLLETPSVIKYYRHFDSAPLSNMRLWDVARVLDNETQRAELNGSLVAKLLNRIITALAHTVLSVEGRPDSQRLVAYVQRGLNRLIGRIPEWGGRNESVELLGEVVRRLPRDGGIDLPDPEPFVLDERLVLANYSKYAKMVAEAYEARPVRDPEAVGSYEVLRSHTHRMFKRLISKVKVEFVDEAEPYADAAEMTRRVKEEGVMYVSTLYSQNLASGWSPSDNWTFRAVHDYIVHVGGKHDFSLRGEIATFNRHAKLAPPDALPALFAEVVGQVAYALVKGKFPSPQKACILYGFDYKDVGKVDPEEYKRNWTEDS